MFAANKALKEQKESAPTPIYQNTSPTPEDVERFTRGKDSWELVIEYLKELKSSAWKVLVLIFYILALPLGIKVIVELTTSRIMVSYFHTYLIAAGIAAVVLLYLWWSHKFKTSNKKDE